MRLFYWESNHWYKQANRFTIQAMNERWSQLYKVLLLVGDFLALVAAFSISYIVRVKIDHRPLAEQVSAVTYLEIFLAIAPLWIVLFAFIGLYQRQNYDNRLRQFSRLFMGSLIGMLFVIGFDFFNNEPIFPARLVPVYAFFLAFGLLLLEREIIRGIRTFAVKNGKGISRLMLIGNAPATAELAAALHNPKRTGYKVVAIVGRKENMPELKGVKHFNNIPAALAKIDALGVESVIQTEWYESSHTNTKIVEAAQSRHIDYKFIPSQNEFYTNNNTVELFHGLPAITVHPTPLIGWGRTVKRLFDFIASCILLIVLSPVFLIISVIIKVTDPRGPVFFSHKRVTRHGKLFDFYKFRTLKIEYSGMPGPEAFAKMGRQDLVKEYEKWRKIPLRRDPRITPIGKFLRKTSLDELPNLWNVVRGDISLVGPRSFEPEELDLYDIDPLILSVNTGITGLWQVSGRNNITFEDRLKLELYYVQHWSFWMDIRILLKTVVVVLSRRGNN